MQYSRAWNQSSLSLLSWMIQSLVRGEQLSEREMENEIFQEDKLETIFVTKVQWQWKNLHIILMTKTLKNWNNLLINCSRVHCALQMFYGQLIEVSSKRWSYRFQRLFTSFTFFSFLCWQNPYFFLKLDHKKDSWIIYFDLKSSIAGKCCGFFIV